MAAFDFEEVRDPAELREESFARVWCSRSPELEQAVALEPMKSTLHGLVQQGKKAITITGPGFLTASVPGAGLGANLLNVLQEFGPSGLVEFPPAASSQLKKLSEAASTVALSNHCLAVAVFQWALLFKLFMTSWLSATIADTACYSICFIQE